MKTEEWEQLEQLLEAAVERPPGDRAAFLEQACGDDSALRREVEALVAADGDAGSFLEEPALPRELQQRFIGPYRVIRQLGAGGTSAVYLAIRADDQYRKRVAVKIFRQPADREDLLRRFRAERQILAGLEHPNIADLHDGGTTEEGLPYFVMEYVEGLPIDRYCDRHRLSVAQRIQLFRTVCSAVHYAHQNLVVHRDIKPGNVLVSVDGVAKLLDFSIAKLLNPEQFPQTVEYTATGLRLMTPRYASPEQVRGERITTASDVYSLGVLLYELLTGHLPYRFKSQSPQDVERAVCEAEPESPSTVIGRSEEVPSSDGKMRAVITPESVSRARGTQPRELRRQLSGDLENILLMALRKEPRRRYASAEQLAEDLRRFIAGLPVAARKATLPYRFGKFVRRNRIAVAVTAVLFVLVLGMVIGFAIAMAAKADQLARERDRMREERDKVEEVVMFLQGLFEISDPAEARGRAITAREILERGAQSIDERLADQPLIRAELMDTIGTLYRRLGLYPQALPLLKKALETRESMLGDRHLDVARSLRSLADLHWHRNAFAEAEPLYLRSLAIHQRLLETDHPDVALTLNNLGNLYWRRGRYDEAERFYTESLAIREKVLEPDHPDVAASLNNLGLLHMTQGRLAEAEPLYLRSLAIKERVLEPDHPDIVASLNNLGLLYTEQGRYAEAEPLHQRVLEIQERILDPDHPALIRSLTSLADLYLAENRYAEAEPLYLRALAIGEEVRGPESPPTAMVLCKLGNLYSQQDRSADAEPLYQRSLAILERTLGADHVYTSEPVVGLARLYRAQSRFADAAPLFQRALAIREQANPSHPDTVELRREHADLLRAVGRDD